MSPPAGASTPAEGRGTDGFVADVEADATGSAVVPIRMTTPAVTMRPTMQAMAMGAFERVRADDGADG